MSAQSFSYNVPVMITKQGRRFVAYTPALDLSTAGRSEKDAKQKFAEAAGVYFEELMAAGTLEEVLTELGWRKVRSKWNPPQVTSTQSVGITVPTPA